MDGFEAVNNGNRVGRWKVGRLGSWEVGLVVGGKFGRLVVIMRRKLLIKIGLTSRIGHSIALCA
jgi:hypothetical protein